ncbi:MAG: hypothetical protein ACR2QO_25735 [Acidimicrobiales bacterium]
MARQRPVPDAEEAAAWFAGRIPDDWFTGPLTVEFDKDEILVSGPLAAPASVPEGEDAERVAALSRISGFREDTRNHRIQIAAEAQSRWRRHVSWGATCGEVNAIFTHASVPVMTRLKFEQRKTLDTLIDSGVAGSRSEALSWCVQQVAEHQSEWIDQLREAMTEVERIRSQGPG